jgi:hypothetical protein
VVSLSVACVAQALRSAELEAQAFVGAA